MLRLILTRVFTTIPLMLVITILAFAMVQAMPGSIAGIILDAGATPEAIAELEAEMGLDRPFFVQYLDWLGNAVRGDLGDSLFFSSPVIVLIRESWPVTASIVLGGMIVGVSLGLILGIVAGLQPGSWLDRSSTFSASITVALPSFWLAMLLAIFLGVRWELFPVIGYTPFSESPTEWLRSITLSSLAMGIPSAALIARQMRSSMANVLQSSYIRAQRAMGLGRWQIVVRHALKNAMIPVVTVIGFRLAVVVGQAFIVESVFFLPGMGKQLATAVQQQDVIFVQGGVVVVAAFIIFANMFIDIIYGLLNPKVRVS
ncbi:MAG: ABC transporter permease [Chloroflexota bacterium]